MALDLCKYYKMQRYVSYNNGVTWQPLDEYMKGELYEAHSPSCGGGSLQYRWVLINNGYICDGKDRYTKEMQQYSEDGVVWYNVFPTTYRKGTLVESNSQFCDNGGSGQYTSGDTEPITGDTITQDCPPNYRWNDTTQECECTGHMKNGECIVCSPNYRWNDTTQECECTGHMVNGQCIVCRPPTFWYAEAQRCLCLHGQDPSIDFCAHVIDPLKEVKCSNIQNGVLTQNNVNYYENGWAAMSYVVGDCVTKIGDSAFNGQVYLTSVTVSSSVEEVGDLAFANCQNLETVSFNSDLTSIGNNVFNSCSKLKYVTFGGTIPSAIPKSMFSNCESLESATFLQTNNIISIGKSAFSNCYSLTNVVFPQTLQTIDNYAYLNNYSLQNITIPSGVTRIGIEAFARCSGMTFATINANDVAIAYGAFRDCSSLTAVTINSSAATIANNAFSGCTNLLKITIASQTPFEIRQGAFDNTNECSIFVPCESLEDYKTAWSSYADRIACIDSGVYYRWIEDGFTCIGTDEYTRQKEQQSRDGITWTDTGADRTGEFITHYSPNCGYVGDVALIVTNQDGYTRYYEPCE